MKYSRPEITSFAPAVRVIQSFTKGGVQHRDNTGMPATYSPPAYEADE
jgi:hypothetical protein